MHTLGITSINAKDLAMQEFDFSIIKHIRQKKGISQEQLANMCGVSVRTVINVEQGKISPSLNSIIYMTNALDLKLTDFIRLSYQVPPKIIDSVDVSYTSIPNNDFRMFEFQGIFLLHVNLDRCQAKITNRFPLFDLYMHYIEGDDIIVNVDGKEHIVKPGDTITYDGMSYRTVNCTSPGKAVVFAVPQNNNIEEIIGVSDRKRLLSFMTKQYKVSETLESGMDFSVIKVIRQAQKIKLETLSELSGISIPAISSIELNKRTPTLSSLSMLAKALNVRLDDLMEFAWHKPVEKASLIEAPEPDKSEVAKSNLIYNYSEINGMQLTHVKNETSEPIQTYHSKTPLMESLVTVISGELTTMINDTVMTYKAGQGLIFDGNFERTQISSVGFEGFALKVPKSQLR